MHRSSDAVIPSAFRLSLVSFATNGTLLICCAAVLDLLAADGDAVDDPAPIYELLAERCRHVRVALEVMTGCE